LTVRRHHGSDGGSRQVVIRLFPGDPVNETLPVSSPPFIHNGGQDDVQILSDGIHNDA
jgi:hypothetical protein